MKKIYVFSLFLCFIATACSSSVEDRSVVGAVTDAAVRDAAKVVEAKPESMEQEGAVLEIKVRENELRDAGFDNEADLYIETVSHILVDSLHVLSSCR